MRLRHRFLLFLLALACATRAHAQEAPGLSLPVREITLENGLRVLVLPRTSSPTVAFVVQYAVGSVNERLGTTGIAHFLEHLMFKGSTSVGTKDVAAERALFRVMDATHDTLLQLRSELRPDTASIGRLEARIRSLEDSARAHVESNEFDRILSREGARGLNATTSSEATTYFVELPANRVELWFALEADRMRNPVFREFYSERDVVMEERRMRTDDSPAGLLAEAHLAAAYQVHPYGVPVVGWMSDLVALSRAEVESYYRRFYGPSNAVVAIVGNVDVEQVTEWVHDYFDGIPPGETPPPVLAREPVQRGERRVVVEYDAEPQLRIGWHVPSLFHEDAPAIGMLSTLLTGGRTSRLYRRLVLDDRFATLVVSSTGPGELFPNLFQIQAVPRSPHTTAELEAAIYEEIARIQETPPSEADLDRVRNQVEAGEVRRLDSNLGLAVQLADSESALGDWRETFRLGARLRNVSAADVQRVARQYLTEANRTVATLMRPAPRGANPQ
jgi:predicted Zn-dependent peptidase